MDREKQQKAPFVEALEGLREDLKTASQSPRSMRMALLGPVSPLALARIVGEEIKSGNRTPTAGAFQLLEILSCLYQCMGLKGFEEWKEYHFKAVSEVKSILQKLRSQVPELQGQFFRHYERLVHRLKGRAGV